MGLLDRNKRGVKYEKHNLNGCLSLNEWNAPTVGKIESISLS